MSDLKAGSTDHVPRRGGVGVGGGSASAGLDGDLLTPSAQGLWSVVYLVTRHPTSEIQCRLSKVQCAQRAAAQQEVRGASSGQCEVRYAPLLPLQVLGLVSDVCVCVTDSALVALVKI
jgi:hypothetical protein